MNILQLLFLNSLCRASVEEIQDGSTELYARVLIKKPPIFLKLFFGTQLRFCFLSIFLLVTVIIQAQEEPVFFKFSLQKKQQQVSLSLSVPWPASQGQASFCFPEQGAQRGQKENHSGDQLSSTGIGFVCWLFVCGFAGFLFKETFAICERLVLRRLGLSM